MKIHYERVILSLISMSYLKNHPIKTKNRAEFLLIFSQVE